MTDDEVKDLRARLDQMKRESKKEQEFTNKYINRLHAAEARAERLAEALIFIADECGRFADPADAANEARRVACLTLAAEVKKS